MKQEELADRQLLLEFLNKKVTLINELWLLWKESSQHHPDMQGDDSLKYALNVLESSVDPKFIPFPPGFRKCGGDQSHVYLPYFEDALLPKQ